MFTVGNIYHRQNDLHDKFGGNRQSGISPSSKYPYIFLFQSPSGLENGYVDGWLSSDIYSYSGEGKIGDMVFMRGNKAILEHQKNGKKLYLFKMIASGFYEYIGEFKYHSHEIISGSDSQGNIRKSIRFNLQKVEEMNN